MKFSYSKFLKLSPEQRIKKLLNFFDDIESAWENISRRQNLLLNLQEFLSFFEQNSLASLSSQITPDLDRRSFLALIVPLELKFAQNKPDHKLHIDKLDGIRSNQKSLDLTLVLDNLRSAFNVGAIIRSAECFGLQNLYFCGYTPDNHKVSQISMGTRELVKVSHFQTTSQAIQLLKSQNCPIFALETAAKAVNIYQATLTLPAALIIGNEALGISSNLLAQADSILKIPLCGWKNSLNVGAATAIALSEFNRFALRSK